MTSDTRETLALLCLALLALATALQAVVLLRLALATRQAAEQAAVLGAELCQELRVGLAHIKRVADDVGQVSEQSLRQVERLEQAIDWSVESGRKAAHTAAMPLWPPLRFAALYKGVKHGLAYYRGSRAERLPAGSAVATATETGART